MSTVRSYFAVTDRTRSTNQGFAQGETNSVNQDTQIGRNCESNCIDADTDIYITATGSWPVDPPVGPSSSCPPDTGSSCSGPDEGCAAGPSRLPEQL